MLFVGKPPGDFFGHSSKKDKNLIKAAVRDTLRDVCKRMSGFQPVARMGETKKGRRGRPFLLLLIAVLFSEKWILVTLVALIGGLCFGGLTVRTRLA